MHVCRDKAKKITPHLSSTLYIYEPWQLAKLDKHGQVKREREI